MFPPNRNRPSEAGRRGEQLRGLLHRGRAAAAGQQPAAAEAATHPEPQPLHRHRPHAHGDGGGHLPQAGAAPVSGHQERVRTQRTPQRHRLACSDKFFKLPCNYLVPPPPQASPRHHHQEGRPAPHGSDDEPGSRVHHVQLAASRREPGATPLKSPSHLLTGKSPAPLGVSQFHAARGRTLLSISTHFNPSHVRRRRETSRRRF